MVTFETKRLGKLCSQDQLDLLDSIDRLRLQGISDYVSLPQIIVCGDQSSGKSSVLQAISGVAFPVKSNLCTRFPTELALRRTPQTSATVSIIPHESRPKSEQEVLAGFHDTLNSFDRLGSVIENAQGTMGITTMGTAFSKDRLRVEITGPGRPHLTIVDLPGLIHSSTKYQTEADIELIKDVVQAYMKEPRAIILAVVSAKNDIANQIVLKLARAADPGGDRTLGVITKPDALIAGSASEASFVSLASNQEVEFVLGWHVLKNMDTDESDANLDLRDSSEASFFTSGVWASGALPQSSLGIDELRMRLSKVLLRQIADELPGLVAEIEQQLADCEDRLAKLGDPRVTVDEQRMYLMRLSEAFQALVKSGVDGTYNDTFFENPASERGYQQRVRAKMQNLSQEFAEELACRGHSWGIWPSDKSNATSGETETLMLTRQEAVDRVQGLMQRSRGRELPGTFNPMIVADLFSQQSQPWEAIARDHIKKAWTEVKRFLDLALTHVADGNTSKVLFAEIFIPRLDAIMKGLGQKLEEMLKPHQSGHPITYNHYFTETLQKSREERRKDKVSKTLKTFFGLPSLGQQAFAHRSAWDFDWLLAELTASSEPDMGRFAAAEALDCMNAYYKVALKSLIDNVAVQVIEAKLVLPLKDILSPIVVHKMSPEMVARIAGESEESRCLRERLTKKRDILRAGSETCRRFMA